MNNFKGVIIEESLINADVLNSVKIISTKVEKVTERHKTPWLKKWTLHTVEIDSIKVNEVVELLSKELLTKPGTWYADFNNEEIFYVVYPYKIFKWKKGEIETIKACKEYGISIGIPSYQVDFPIN